MGKTVESHRMALESEISRWNGFARALGKEDREVFAELLDMSRSFAMAAGNACDPILFEPFIMSILLAQKERIVALEKKLSKSRGFTYGAGGGIRTHEPLQDRLLKPTPLTMLGDPCKQPKVANQQNNSYPNKPCH